MKNLLLLTAFVLSLFAATTGGKLSDTARSLEKRGYVNVQKADPSIFVSLMYSRADNFTGEILYTDLREAYLHPKAAAALVKAQKRLRQLRPDLSLKVYDAARPMSIQQKMWDKVKNTPKYFYVSNPARGGGLHNYGMAVDLTLCTLEGDSVPMGTKIDYMGAAAHIDKEASLVASGRISRVQAAAHGVVALQLRVARCREEILQSNKVTCDGLYSIRCVQSVIVCVASCPAFYHGVDIRACGGNIGYGTAEWMKKHSDVSCRSASETADRMCRAHKMMRAIT